MILVPSILTSAIFVAISILLLLAAHRFGGRKIVFIVGGLLSAFVAFEIVQTLVDCSAEPRFIPPSCDPSKCGEDGQMVFACDSAGGVLAYSFAYLFGPLTVFVVCVLTCCFAKNPRKIDSGA